MKYVYLIQSLAVPDQRYIGTPPTWMSGFEPIMRRVASYVQVSSLKGHAASLLPR
jgi:hypothetical protein